MGSTQNDALYTAQETGVFNPFDLDNPKAYPGKPSAIQDYCREKRKNLEIGDQECLWVCIRRGGRDFAFGLPANDIITIDQLQKLYGRWTRYSLFRATTVKPVKVCQYYCIFVVGILITDSKASIPRIREVDRLDRSSCKEDQFGLRNGRAPDRAQGSYQHFGRRCRMWRELAWRATQT